MLRSSVFVLEPNVTSAYAIIAVVFFIALVAVGLAVDHVQSKNRGWAPAWEILLFWRGRRTLSQTNSVARAEVTRYLGRSGPVAIFVVAAVGWFAFLHQSENTYATRIGEVRAISLPDHITAILNTDTRLTWVQTEGAPRVVLLQGEALFETPPNPAKRLSVRAGNSLIRDIGTRFDVYRRGDGTVLVTVISGAVVVKGLGNPEWERRLQENQQIEYSQSGPVTDVRAVSAPAAISWREGIFQSPGLPLSEFLRELNRYTDKPIVLLGKGPCSDEKIGGGFPTTNVGDTLRRLKTIAGVAVTEESGRYIVSCRSTAPPR